MAFLILTCCSDGKARELFETAQFEELQKNFDHAGKLYEDIVKKYPESELAGKAKERIEELRKSK